MLDLPEGNGIFQREEEEEDIVESLSTTEIHMSILGLHGDVSKFRNMSWERFRILQ